MSIRIPSAHRHVLIVACIALLGISACVAPLQLGWVSQPQIRVGILEGRTEVDFMARDDFSVRDFDGAFVARGVKGRRWRATVVGAKPAPRRFRLLVTRTRSESAAERRVSELTSAGLPAVRETVHKDYPPAFLGREVSPSYVVVLKQAFSDSAEAVSYQRELEAKVETTVIAEATGASQGRLVLTNLDDPRQRFEADRSLRISGSYVALLDVEYGTGYHWASSEHRAYGGMLEFILDRDARITVVDLLPIEDYLAGVVPSEMPRGFPLEALKAQAVAARTEVIAKIGINHPNDPFDVCDEVHCQVFSGIGKEAASTTRAVAETRGMVMKYKGQVINAVYSAVCGGHTENNENVWAGEPSPYLRGILDAATGLNSLPTALKNEQNVRGWVENLPEVYCNTVSHPIPDALQYTKKYFRWEVRYARSDLEEILRQKTGRDFGQLVDLVPLERGVSGRIIRLRVVGTGRSFVLRRELVIRRSLSPNVLYSADFVVDKEGGDSSLSDFFVIKGAGWGHGVGMCQTGAAQMAIAGRSFDEILRHYYSGIELAQMY